MAYLGFHIGGLQPTPPSPPSLLPPPYHLPSQACSQDCQNEEADRSSATPSPSLPSEVDPLNLARGSGSAVSSPSWVWGLRPRPSWGSLQRFPSRNRFWCILALKSGIWSLVASILSLNGAKNNPKIVTKITAVRPKGGGASHKGPP